MLTVGSIGVLAGSAVAAAAIVWWVRRLARARALLDRPNARSSHDVPKPRMGGIGIVVPVLATGLWLVATGRAPSGWLVTLGGATLVAAVGLLDDLRPLRARTRFAVQTVGAVAAVAAGWTNLPAAFGAVGTVLPVPVLAAVATLGILWSTNLYNFMDGIDGIAGSQAVFAGLALAIVAGASGAGAASTLLLAVAGASAGFLVFNLPPSSIFMGDVGSTTLGFLFASLPLLPGAPSVGFPPVVIALSFFVLDATTTLVRRVMRGERWYDAHRTHLYQRPVVAGLGHAQVLRAAAIAFAISGVAAVAWSWDAAPARVAACAASLAVFLAGAALVRRVERRESGGSHLQ